MEDFFFRYIQNEDHYTEVVERMRSVKRQLWIGTADIKDLYIEEGKGVTPLLKEFSNLAKRGVELRLIHAKEPGENFRKDFDRYPILIHSLERVLCPRVHFKIILFDLKIAYVGSANLTGAGLGMKNPDSRNFEAGILSNHPDFVKAAMNQFDSVWMGSWCEECRRKEYCPDPIL